MKKKLTAILGFFLLLIIGFIGIWMYALFTPIVTKADGYVYYLRPGVGKRQLIADLSQQGILPHPFLSSLYIYPQNVLHLKKGEYFFRQGTTLSSLWKQVTTGTGLYYHPFTIVPGW
ncbi:MAG: hypothetical protein JO149_06710, partial [Gammaproteobacteria bacterium]|nr:hypothetical protein [Gammaproteobacteria bacterium]